jgi:hypothetical protein
VLAILSPLTILAAESVTPPTAPNAFAQNQRLGRGVNILGYDRVWGPLPGASLRDEHFRLIRQAGFQSVRICLFPFRETRCSKDGPIPDVWLDKVDWAVKQALSQGLAVVVDCHEGCELPNYRGAWLYLWKQLGNRFKDSPPEVVFELLNEPCGMTADAWNRLLLEGLATVRQTNPTRTVIVGPAHWSEIELLDSLHLPEHDRNVIVAVHYYDPMWFTHQGLRQKPQYPAGKPWMGDEQQRQAIVRDFQKAQVWAKRTNRPLFLGEFGTYDRADIASRARWTKCVRQEAERLGWSWAYWHFAGTGFGICDYSSSRWVEPIRDALVSPSCRPDSRRDAEAVILDGRGPGRTFEGIGGLSAGAGTRLLPDYPERQRSDVLDYLFRPNFGASLHHLKVEIGGDVNSTEGTEPSHARTREEFEHPRPEYSRRGYEWWLMREAKKRNPHVYLDVLQWGAPHWIGDKNFPDVGNPNDLKWPERMTPNRRKFYTQDNAEFVASFIRGAKDYHALDIDYCGIWNENLHDSAWIKLLRKTLDCHGLTKVRIIGCDEDGKQQWGIVDEFPRDAELNNAVSVVGVHYPRCASPAAARQCGKPLWASEDNPGWNSPEWMWGLATAKMFNRNYIQGKMTKTVFCYLIDSFYDSLAWANSAPMKANTPWSGHYEVWPTLWAIAHTTQFAQPGWRYLDHACGLLPKGGSYVSLRSPEPRGDYSVLLETSDAKSPQTFSFRTNGGLTTGPLHVWRSNAADQFERQGDLTPVEGLFTLTVQPRCVYSLTTTTGQHKGKTEIPPSADFPMPYEDDFERYEPGKMAKYFSDQAGVFEVARRPEGGKCLRQTVSQRGIDWRYYPNPEPFTILGDAKWRNYELACDVCVEKAGHVTLLGRITSARQAHSPQPVKGYWLKVDAQGRWELNAFDKTLAGGTVAFAADRWHKLLMRFIGPRVFVCIDGKKMAEIADPTFSDGMVGVGSGWNNAMYDDLSVQTISSVP